jgi:hypothetical protein
MQTDKSINNTIRTDSVAVIIYRFITKGSGQLSCSNVKEHKYLIHQQSSDEDKN